MEKRHMPVVDGGEDLNGNVCYLLENFGLHDM
jgi:hypothetical protein